MKRKGNKSWNGNPHPGMETHRTCGTGDELCLTGPADPYLTIPCDPSARSQVFSNPRKALKSAHLSCAERLATIRDKCPYCPMWECELGGTT